MGRGFRGLDTFLGGASPKYHHTFHTTLHLPGASARTALAPNCYRRRSAPNKACKKAAMSTRGASKNRFILKIN